MLKAIVNYFWGNSDADLTLEDAYSVLENDTETSNELVESTEITFNEGGCTQKLGTITAAHQNTYTIDDLYIFKSTAENLQIGSQVSFVVYVSDGDLKVSNVTICDEWLYQETAEKTWCRRCIIGKVTHRDKRNLFLTPNDLSFNLDEVAIEFVPVIGDWLKIEAKVELDEAVLDLSGKILEIEQVQPLRSHICEGIVKKWDNGTDSGIINRSIYFSGTALGTGYVPLIGDKVVAEVIESEQGIYNKRATKVVPLHATTKTCFTTALNLLEKVPKFDTDSKYVHISDNLYITATSLGTIKDFKFKVENTSKETVTLMHIDLPRNSQCSIKQPCVLTDLKIAPGQSINLEGTCTLKNVGTKKELAIFYFDRCTIGRSITTCVESNVTNDSSPVTNKRSFNTSHFKNNSSNLIKGQRISLTPRFIAKRLPDYPIPQKLLDIASSYCNVEFTKEVCNFKPSLTMKLQYNNYEDRFHTLLHLEELTQMEAIKNYNRDLTCFIKNGEFLMLEIENLAEKRPSLIVGDRIIAKNPYDPNAQEYEGYIHKIQANHIFLKFSQMFHEDYNGEDVSIMAIASRTTYRRMHQAIGQAVVNLRSDFIFSQKIQSKQPQVAFLKDQEKKNFHWFNNSLNYYQKEAVWNILLGTGRPLPYLIYGPPGTGKTVTLVECILQILMLIPNSRIIVATPSNSSANLVSSRLINSNILKPGDLIRLVGYQYFNQDALPIELIPYAATVDSTKEGTYNNFFDFDGFKAPIGLNSTAIGRHRITVATCSSIGSLFSLGFPKGHFTHIIVDEAGQTTEPEIMIPLSLLDVSSGQVVLAGDPRQLGPTVISKAACQYGLEETYLDRMLDRYPYVRDFEGFPQTKGFNPQFITKLVYNYRSLPDILELPSKMFYDGQLIATINRTDSEEASLLENLKTILPIRQDSNTPAIVFHGVLGENSRSSDSPSWFNANEASQVFYYVNELYRMGVKNTDIGIISPYVKQVKLIRALLNEAEFDLPKLGTVEEFQGHENKIILLTTVRSSEDFLQHDTYFNLGFVSNVKRLNVAITRARALLILVGNPHLLMKDHYWRTIIKYCVKDGGYCGCDLPVH